ALWDESERNRATTTNPEHLVQTLLEFLWRVVGAANDHHVFGPSTNVELLVANETEIAGVEPAAHQRPLSRRAIVEVACHDRCAAHPNAAHATLWELLARVLATNLNLDARHREAHRCDAPRAIDCPPLFGQHHRIDGERSRRSAR